jgi:hypothetical protein
MPDVMIFQTKFAMIPTTTTLAGRRRSAGPEMDFGVVLTPQEL